MGNEQDLELTPGGSTGTPIAAVEAKPAARGSGGEDFVREFQRCWARLPDKAMFFGLLAGWAVLFHFLGNCTFSHASSPSLFVWLKATYDAPAFDAAHGYLIPPVVLVLLWVKREALLKEVRGVWWPALLPLGVAAVLHVVGFLAQQARLSLIAWFLCIYSLVGLVWGWRLMRASFFPFCLFAFGVPLGTFVERFTLPLRQFSTSLTVFITRDILGFDLIRQGTQIVDAKGAYNYEVAAACSGIRSFIALLAIAVVFSMLVYKAWWRRAATVAFTVPLVVVCNVLRLCTIIIAAQTFGQAAGNFVHEWFGYVTYAVAIGGLLLLNLWMKEPPTTPAP